MIQKFAAKVLSFYEVRNTRVTEYLPLIYRMTEHCHGQRFRADAFEAMMKVELCHLGKLLLSPKKPIVSVKHVDILVMPICEKVFEGLA